MVLGTAEAVERDTAGDDELTSPTFRSVLLRGLPAFLREGFLPLGAFYLGWRTSGLTAGVVTSTIASILIYAHERRTGRGGLLVRLSLAFVLVQAVVGLVSNSAIVYLAAPVIVNGIWALAFLVSAVIRRPLAGVFACAWYPFTDEMRATEIFKRVYGVESVVWGLYLAARAALRIGVLLTGHIGAFLVVVFLTGTPMMFALIAWSIRYAIRRFEAAAA